MDIVSDVGTGHGRIITWARLLAGFLSAGLFFFFFRYNSHMIIVTVLKCTVQ